MTALAARADPANASVAPMGQSPESSLAAASHGNLDYYWDCNVNDYFHPNPPAGSFLAMNWNLASCSNRMVYRPSCGVAPSAAEVGRAGATSRVGG
ncbi:hypothetical protein CKY47_14835 [Saccharothrix yanglingensis]|uniref:Uncharacterized protein n=1 Tax=Saccharothrix yanglingensis TaxID=659496 RepID=A0ABU0WZE0_9PSEU|nr:hypothetical protein [Saccharothrix yanglingensis]